MAPLSLQEISDRFEINDLLTRYTRAIDTTDFELLDTCFMPDAFVDYTSSGGVKGQYPKVRAWLAKALAPFPAMMHFVGNSTVELDGDEATLTNIFGEQRTLSARLRLIDNNEGKLVLEPR